MKIDYDVGDVVVCVDDVDICLSTGRRFKCPLKLGAIYRVSKVCYFEPLNSFGIHLKSGPQSPSLHGWHTNRFRKLPKADTEFTEQMRRCKPAKRKVDA